MGGLESHGGGATCLPGSDLGLPPWLPTPRPPRPLPGKDVVSVVFSLTPVCLCPSPRRSEQCQGQKGGQSPRLTRPWPWAWALPGWGPHVQPPGGLPCAGLCPASPGAPLRPRVSAPAPRGDRLLPSIGGPGWLSEGSLTGPFTAWGGSPRGDGGPHHWTALCVRETGGG